MESFYQVYLENRGSSVKEGTLTQHSKFYLAEDDGQKVIFRWGSTGSYESIKTKTAGAGVKIKECEDRRATIDAQVRAKIKKGYVRIWESGSQTGGLMLRHEERPSNEGRGFGLEIETHTHISLDEIIEGMRKRGLAVNDSRQQYFHSNGSAWDVKRDGSCGYEIASPILRGECGIFDAKLAAEKIREICPNATNSNCGVHVTVGVEDHSKEDLKRLIAGYLKAQEHFYAKCNSTRQKNSYCARNPINKLGLIIAAPSTAINEIAVSAGGLRHEDRYKGLNLTNVFKSSPRVEFRMLESTTEIRKLGAWIETCVNFVSNLKSTQYVITDAAPMSEEDFNALTI